MMVKDGVLYVDHAEFKELCGCSMIECFSIARYEPCPTAQLSIDEAVLLGIKIYKRGHEINTNVIGVFCSGVFIACRLSS